MTPFEGPHRMTGDDVRRATFPETRGFSRGYDEIEVDKFLDRVALALDEAGVVVDGALAEAEHLKGRLMAGEVDRVAQSVSILSRAQQTADETVARADEHSAKVMTEAKSLYEEARQKAAQIVDESHRQASEMADAAVADHGEIARQTAYLRTMRDVARTQMESFLMGLYDRVAEEYGRAHPSAAEAATPVVSRPARAADPGRTAAPSLPARSAPGGQRPSPQQQMQAQGREVPPAGGRATSDAPLSDDERVSSRG